MSRLHSLAGGEKIDCMILITGSKIVGISSFVNFSFLLCLTGCIPLFQFMTKLVILVACSHFPHMTGIYTCVIQSDVPFLCGT